MGKLKPCPKCGASTHGARHIWDAVLKRDEYEIRCSKFFCSELYGFGHTKEEAEENWNSGKLVYDVDENSFNAGIKATVELFESQAKLTEDDNWKERLYEMAEEIRCLPVPKRCAL